MSGTDRRALLLVLALASCAPEPAAPPPPGHAGAAAFPAPSRPVSAIVSPQWATEDDRDRASEYDRVVALLQLGPGMKVADVGAGTGYYTVRLARTVGREGRVYAEDITPDYVSRLRERVRSDSNVRVVLGVPHDPLLPDTSVNVALLIHMYHEIEQPFALLYNLAPALRPGARVAVLDMDRPTGSHGTPPALLECELQTMGYLAMERADIGGGAYLETFSAPVGDMLTPPDSVAPRLASGACAAVAR